MQNSLKLIKKKNWKNEKKRKQKKNEKIMLCNKGNKK